MTPHWHDGALDTLGRYRGPVIWCLPNGGPGERQAAAHALIAQVAGGRAEAVCLARTAAGAPRVLSPAGWHIGLSRRGGRCVIGVASRPIAVDIELLDDAPPLWDMLTDNEASDLQRLAAADRPRAWLRRWTIKEAHAKLIGEPRRLAPETIDTRIIDPVQATATYEGISRCWTRDAGDAIMTVAQWDDAGRSSAAHRDPGRV